MMLLNGYARPFREPSPRRRRLSRLGRYGARARDRVGNEMNGLASRNRYFFWEPRPHPGELEYLAGAELRHSARTGYDRLVKMPPALMLDNRWYAKS